MGETSATHAPVGRIEALDGLRGVAALVVLISHSMVSSPQLHAVVKGEDSGGQPAWVGLLAHTPLYLLWAGTEAVFVFYLLSGFVLTVPFLRAKRPSWLSYYPKRLLRLYLPSVGAVAVALAAAALVPRVASGTLSPWINDHSATPNPLRDAALVLGTGWLNTPLWSLKWEVLFSLMLPVYIFLALRMKPFWIFCVAFLLAAIWLTSVTEHFGPMYLVMFGIGALMATQRERLQAWGQRLGRLAEALLIVVALMLLSVRALFPALEGWQAFAVLGSAGIIWTLISHPLLPRSGWGPPLRWLGSRSFSLYLVHEPIVVSVALSLNTSNPFLVLALSVPLSLLVAEAFFRVVERPSHKLANAIGKLLERRRSRSSVLLAPAE